VEADESPATYPAFKDTEYSTGEERPPTIIGEIVEDESIQGPVCPFSE
jgi:hypothetical protein